MEKFVKELRKLVPFKETTEVGDIVLVVIEETEMAGYALVTGIERDHSRKDEWWEVHMQFLTVPLQPIVWTLRTEQFTGQETFTMGGKGRFVQAVDVVQEAAQAGGDQETVSSSLTKKNTGKKGGLRLVK
ncbi:hypothetical protein [Candidatus Electrothrix sp.]|uniref:hypothetical protein n=1 Tax=Candidatus Electrothrix sp. TaxID=2170559 RepID=UPI004057B8BD